MATMIGSQRVKPLSLNPESGRVDRRSSCSNRSSRSNRSATRKEAPETILPSSRGGGKRRGFERLERLERFEPASRWKRIAATGLPIYAE